jgi:hypothetical protein
MISHARSVPSIGLLAAIALLGCAAGEEVGFTVRDSAGIRIVENSRAAWNEAERWTIAAQPTVDIGGGDAAGAHLLHQVYSARRFVDGRIAVPNGATADVRIFDSAGRHLSTIGRRGQGPGEFRAPWRIMEGPGDTIVVLDIGRGFRFNLFAPDGSFVRSFTTPVSRQGAEGTVLIGWFADGSSLVRRHELESREPTGLAPVRSYISLFRLGPDGTMLDSLGRFPYQTSVPGGYVWGPRAHEAVHDSTVYFGTAESYEIRRYSMRGELRGIVRRSRPNAATTAADIKAFQEESRRTIPAEGNDPSRRAVLEQRLAGMRFAPTFPAYYYLQVDQPGNLWVQEYSTLIGEGRVWSVFDTADVYLGDIELPERFRVFQIGDDWVLGQWRDADEVEHLRLYRIMKPY